ncbi:branched-chain amino acid ABC transporter permease [Natronomonas marina]|uniref:branched-chain amino acid ABC transporter permease n=1 Tax=Natronomonas marina TaxID=2961939 RepID=UPI003D9C93F5
MVALLVAYPLVYQFLVGLSVVLPGTGIPLGQLLNVFLPRVTTMVAVLYIGLFAMSFDFVSGYTGYLSFGHAMFYGIGAYFVVLAGSGKVPGLAAETPFLLLLLVGAVLAFIVALAVGAVSFRLTGVYFAMVTLGFAEVARVFIQNWDYVGSNPRDGASVAAGREGFAVGYPGLPDFLGGLPGVIADPRQVRLGRLTGDSFENVLGLGIDLEPAFVSYYAIGVVVLVCYLAMQRVIHSPFGRVMVAIRENEERAEAVGYDTFWYKLGAFGLSGFFAAVGGGLFAGYRRSVAPSNTFDLFVTADALLASIIGGFGTLAGPLYGHLFHETTAGVLSTESHGLARFLRDELPASVLSAGVGDFTLLRFVNVFVDGRADLYLGVVFILFVLFVPRGILGTLRARLGGTVAEKLPERLDRYRR